MQYIECVPHFLVPSSNCRKSELLICFRVSPAPSPFIALLLLLPVLQTVLLKGAVVDDDDDDDVAAEFSDICNDLGSRDTCVRPRPRL
jgi:hypothetical protein